MTDSTEVVLARLAAKIEALTGEVQAMHKDVAALNDFKSRFNGGTTVVCLLMSVFFAATGWLIHTQVNQGREIAKIESAQQHNAALIDRNTRQITDLGSQLNPRHPARPANPPF